MPLVLALKQRLRDHPRLERLLRFLLAPRRGNIPPAEAAATAREIEAVKHVLESGRLNMLSGRPLAHEELEREFARVVGAEHAVAVASGGMAIQMVLRALGLRPGDEVIHQVDTCVANAFSVLNAGATPVFADVSETSFMASHADMLAQLSPRTRVLMPVHMWGNPDDVQPLVDAARARGLLVVEDACLALGATRGGRHVGTWGTAGIFSFGMLKPLHAGEGGMVVTHDAALARELRVIRSYGDLSHEAGARDQKTLSWNGRMAEIVAALALQRLRAYRDALDEVTGRVGEFKLALARLPGLEVVDATGAGSRSAYSQLVLRLDEAALGLSKAELRARLERQGVETWHANFEPVTHLSFFREGGWRPWVGGDPARAEGNYCRDYPAARRVFERTGLGVPRSQLLGARAVQRLADAFARSIDR